VVAASQSHASAHARIRLSTLRAGISVSQHTAILLFPSLLLRTISGGFVMTHEQFRCERDYGAAMAIASEMAARGLVTPEEYDKLDARFRQMHRPLIARILHDMMAD